MTVAPPDPDDPRAGAPAAGPASSSLLWGAVLAHLAVLAARHHWIEPDPEVFRGTALTALAVFLLGPAVLVGLAVGLPARWDRARMWRAVAFAWWLTALVHALILLANLGPRAAPP